MGIMIMINSVSSIGECYLSLGSLNLANLIEVCLWMSSMLSSTKLVLVHVSYPRIICLIFDNHSILAPLNFKKISWEISLKPLLHKRWFFSFFGHSSLQYDLSSKLSYIQFTNIQLEYLNKSILLMSYSRNR